MTIEIIRTLSITNRERREGRLIHSILLLELIIMQLQKELEHCLNVQEYRSKIQGPH